jgi:hypothetical protein
VADLANVAGQTSNIPAMPAALLHRLALWAAPILLVLLAAAGCGGGENGDGGGRLSASEYRQNADAVCKRADEDLRALPQPKSAAELDGFVDKVEPIVEGAVEDLDELSPPEDLEAAHDRWVSQNREVLTALEELRNASPATIRQKATEFAELSDRATKTARDDLGLDECGPENT